MASCWHRWNGPGFRDSSDWLERELGNLRAAFRWSVERDHIEVATDVAAHAALVGCSAQLFETIGWAEELLGAATAANPARLPRLYTAAGYACFAGRAVAAAQNAHTAVELEAQPGYDPCQPGLALFIEALASVYSGDLNRYVELSAEAAKLPGTTRAFALPAYVDGLQASGRVDEAVALIDESIAAAHEVGNPFWIVYALWTAGLAYAHNAPERARAAWDQGLEVVTGNRVRFFEGFLARDGALLHARQGDLKAALSLFATAIDAFQKAGNVAQLIITVASVPEVFERLGHHRMAATLHSAITQLPASTHHVPDLADLGERLAKTLGAAELAECLSAGRALDLNAAAATPANTSNPCAAN